MPFTKWRPGPPLTAASEVAGFVPAADWLVPPLSRPCRLLIGSRCEVLPPPLAAVVVLRDREKFAFFGHFLPFFVLSSTFLREFLQRCTRGSAWSCFQRSLPLLCAAMEAAGPAGPPRARDGGRARNGGRGRGRGRARRHTVLPPLQHPLLPAPGCCIPSHKLPSEDPWKFWPLEAAEGRLLRYGCGVVCGGEAQ
eukprot:XP_027326147.1 uncharacterized protein LOC113845379 isoform X3 [Anas platyrhynchos]